MSADLTTFIAAFRNRARSRVVLLTDALAARGAGSGTLLRQAGLLTDALDVLDSAHGLAEPRLRLLLGRLDELCRLGELALVNDPDAPAPLPAPLGPLTPIYLGSSPGTRLPLGGTAGQVLTHGPADGQEYWANAAGLVHIAGITEFRDRFGPSFDGTAEQALRTLLVRFQLPSFTTFTLDGQGSRTVEVGTAFATVARAFAWTTGNPASVAANTLSLLDVTGALTLAANTANDGARVLPVAAFTAVSGESRRYRLTARDTQGTSFQAELVVYGDYSIFYGPAAAAPTASAQVRALASSQLGGSGVTLNTGTAQRIFCVWLPPGRRLSAAADLDALGADVLGQYVPTAQAVNDAGGNPVAGTLYTLTQAVPYGSSHRHQLSFA